MHDNQSKNQPDQVSLLRMMDAAANRTLEGLRVVEDAVRFGLDDRHLTERLKQSRHHIATALASEKFAGRLSCRDTLGDVGTDVRTEQEANRAGLTDIIQANLARAQEGLRTLAECAKTIAPTTAETFEQTRYALYTFQKAIATTQLNNERLAESRLYVLVDGQRDPHEFERVVRMLIESQVDVIQLRDKQLDDRTLLSRAKQLCDLTRAATASDRHPHTNRPLAIVNDRADIAAVADADGVHVGQDELSVAAVRSIVGPDALIGVSTHNIEQARQAVLEGADYLGVGPTFPSQTKDFAKFPGVALLEQVAAEITLPAFAIGGINPDNIAQVSQAGLRRVAVSGSVVASDNPRSAIQALRASL